LRQSSKVDAGQVPVFQWVSVSPDGTTLKHTLQTRQLGNLILIAARLTNECQAMLCESYAGTYHPSRFLVHTSLAHRGNVHELTNKRESLARPNIE
jgi:hypothetical protein